MRPLTLSQAVDSFNSWNSWPVVSKNRHEFHEFHENDDCRRDRTVPAPKSGESKYLRSGTQSEKDIASVTGRVPS